MVKITPTGSHFKLYSWMLAKVVQLTAIDFCKRYWNTQTDPKGRQFDQTTQAARSIAANIAEGASRHDTSRETEMRLLDVARASTSETIDDLMTILWIEKSKIWQKDSPEFRAVFGVKIPEVNYGNDWLADAFDQVDRVREVFAPWLTLDDPAAVANALIVICRRIDAMLTAQLQAHLRDFEATGGFTENLTKNRLSAQREQAAAEDAPMCPKCGAVMVMRVAKRGSRIGKRFWSCSKFYETGCSETLNID